MPLDPSGWRDVLVVTIGKKGDSYDDSTKTAHKDKPFVGGARLAQPGSVFSPFDRFRGKSTWNRATQPGL